MGAAIADVMEAPFPGVVDGRPGARGGRAARPARRQALIVSEHGRPVGIVTRTDLLESLVS